MQMLKGRLMFLGWQNKPWRLVTDQGDVDLWPIVERFFVGLNGKLAAHKEEIDGYVLSADAASEFRFKYDVIWLRKDDGTAGSNVEAYFERALVWLSGRMVEIEISDTELKLMADKSEKVFGVHFTGEGNSCGVSEDVAQTICRIGQEDCCIFVSAGGEGFSCEKFNDSTARYLLDRLAKGTIRAKRIGSCAVLGRKE